MSVSYTHLDVYKRQVDMNWNVIYDVKRMPQQLCLQRTIIYHYVRTIRIMDNI